MTIIQISSIKINDSLQRKEAFMKKKKRNIYEVAEYRIDRWDDEKCVPDMESFVLKNYLITPDIVKAFYFYREINNNNNESRFLHQLKPIKIEISDKEWLEMNKKDKLLEQDYKAYILEETADDIAYDLYFDGKGDDKDDILEEVLRVKSEIFNMRLICDMAGVNFSTFRGFKYNDKSLSKKKVKQLIETMALISKEIYEIMPREKEIQQSRNFNMLALGEIYNGYQLDKKERKSSIEDRPVDVIVDKSIEDKDILIKAKDILIEAKDILIEAENMFKMLKEQSV